MFCPNCGTNLPDGSAFCAGCGSRLNQEQPVVNQAPVYSAPATPEYEAATPPAYQDGPILNKSTWLKTSPSPKAKQMSNLSLILTAACALVLILALCTSIFGPFYNVPIFKIALGEDYVQQIDELKDDLEDASDELDWFEDRYSDELDDDDVERAYKSTVNLIENPSLGNCRAWADAFGEADVVNIFDTFIGVLWVSFGFVILLAVLGGLLKKTGLVITAIVFSVPANLLFGGTLFLILSIAALVALAVVLSQINKEYKAYKNSVNNVYSY